MSTIDVNDLDPARSPFNELNSGSGRPPSIKRVMIAVLIIMIVVSLGLRWAINTFARDPGADARAGAERFTAAVVEGWPQVDREFPVPPTRGLARYFGRVSHAELASVSTAPAAGPVRLRALVWAETEAGSALLHLQFARRPAVFGRYRLVRIAEVGRDVEGLALSEQRAARLDAAVRRRGGLYPSGRGLAASLAPPTATLPPEGPPQPAPQPQRPTPRRPTARGQAISVLGVRRDVKGLPSNRGISFVGVRVRACARRASISLTDFTLVNNDGMRFPALPLQAPKPQLGTIERGCRTGWVTFGTLRGTAVDVLVYASGGVDRRRIRLPR